MDEVGVIIAIGNFVDGDQHRFKAHKKEHLGIIAKGDRVTFVIKRNGGLFPVAHGDVIGPEEEVAMVLVKSNQTVQ